MMAKTSLNTEGKLGHHPFLGIPSHPELRHNELSMASYSIRTFQLLCWADLELLLGGVVRVGTDPHILASTSVVQSIVTLLLLKLAGSGMI